MERYKIELRDSERRIFEESTLSVATNLLASLATDPTTLPELEIAFSRFGPGMDLSWFSEKLRQRDEDDRFLIIDLSSKSLCGSSELLKFFPRGEVIHKSPKDENEFPIRYWIADEWKIFDSYERFSSDVEMRRSEFQARTRIDFREVLYGQSLIEFLVTNFTGDAAKCHSEWLLTPREDLAGMNPREVLLSDRERVDFDLYSRELQWSFGGSCPPLIPLDSDAFRYAAIGTHEFVVYYDLIRHLLENFSNDIGEMEDLKAKWLESPDSDGPMRIPSEIIECERKRLPLEATASEMMIDEDCPICQMMMSEFDTPTFMHLDSAHFDDEYVFSTYKTEEEYLKNRQEWKEFNKRFEEENKMAELASRGDESLL